MPLFLVLYFVLLIYTLKMQNYIYLAIVIIFGIFIIALYYVLINMSVKRVKKASEILSENIDADIKPFVNVNRINWKILQHLPGFSRVTAKKIVWLRKHNGLYSSVDNFLTRNGISDEKTQLMLKKIVYSD